jgi:hypothetical protein
MVFELFKRISGIIVKKPIFERTMIFIRKVWFNTPRLAAAQRTQRMRAFGIKTDV